MVITGKEANLIWEGTDPIRTALAELEQLDARKALIARLRLVGRLTIDQIAVLLGASQASVGHDWCFARAWLAREAGCQCS